MFVTDTELSFKICPTDKQVTSTKWIVVIIENSKNFNRKLSFSCR